MSKDSNKSIDLDLIEKIDAAESRMSPQEFASAFNFADEILIQYVFDEVTTEKKQELETLFNENILVKTQMEGLRSLIKNSGATTPETFKVFMLKCHGIQYK